ncbi:PREDICTED: ubiquitin-conjugating enzyme E2 Z-like [Amphimedon queenslandica]|uniref:Ubiquitin-conjugating enzyme E2 Z n=1 Tax=Amphimedon queenslandica TaxID=400682 RepID=A0A1X7TI88_AMPQE|nr:PREDICTED: ubiquitin-conjugating enzyme E2 Z-like [Amphimedon queenslandica]|eukprot:XP_003390484.1 PREDICTED: ubiquitin-conjugating enzyme E2 Z-like [Amphimedon queenslandica]
MASSSKVTPAVDDNTPGEIGATSASIKEEIKWDPFQSPDWDLEKPTSDAIVRMKRDLHLVFSDPLPGIFIAPESDDITRLHALITGPFDTPYEGGFFHFMLRFPPSYPFHPPRVKFMTTGSGTVRFNPNLYRNGKVCLSILGTWPGPQWAPAQNLSSVLMSIQSLMNEKPFHNEPGFHKERLGWEVKSYNDIIRHETLRVAVCDVLERKSYPIELMEVVKLSFMQFYEYYSSTIKKYAPELDDTSMNDPFGINKGTFNFKKLSQRIEKLQLALSSSSL